MMRIDSRKMQCFRLHYGGRRTKIVKAPDCEAVKHWLAEEEWEWPVIKHIPRSSEMDTHNGADLVIDWSGKVLRTK